MEILYTRALTVNDGTYSVTSDDPKCALQSVVRFARDCGHKPPRWWQFWRPRWPKDAVAEFHRDPLPLPPSEEGK